MITSLIGKTLHKAWVSKLGKFMKINVKIQGVPQGYRVSQKDTGFPTRILSATQEYRVSHETWQLVNSFKCLPKLVFKYLIK